MPRFTTSSSEDFGTPPHPAAFPSSFTQFPAISLQVPSILIKFTMMLHISRAMVFSSVVVANLLTFAICVTFTFVKF